MVCSPLATAEPTTKDLRAVTPLKRYPSLCPFRPQRVA